MSTENADVHQIFLYAQRWSDTGYTARIFATLIEALLAGCAEYSVNDFYYLSRRTLVKDEKNLDKFAPVGGHCFNGFELFGWRSPFFFVAGATVVMLLIGIVVIRDAPPDYSNSLNTPSTMGQSIRGYINVLRHPRFFNLLAMGFVAYGPAVAIIGMWGGPFLEDTYGLNGWERGQILFLMMVAVPIGALFFGPLDRVFKSRKTIVFVAVTTELIAFGALGFIENLSIFAVTCLFVYIAFVQQYYVVLAAQCRAAFPDHLVGRANSTLNLISITGVGFMQSMFGWILAISTEAGYRHSFIFVSATLAIALLIYSRSSEKPMKEIIASAPKFNHTDLIYYLLRRT